MSTPSPGRTETLSGALTAVALILAVVPTAERWLVSARSEPAIGAAGRCSVVDVAVPALPSGPSLASWQTVGGCGAGSATGIGGIKWIGRSVRGGLVQVQCQGNYTRYTNGYSYTLNNQVTADLGEKWNVGVLVPYLYKYLYNPFGLTGASAFDLSNQGPGDVNVLLTRRLGPVNATTLTVSLGMPTGTHAAQYNLNYLPQDRQLGTGGVSGAMLLEHTVDELWGPVVLGATLSYPGRENDLQNFRAPSATAYGYAGYLLGPLVPALGLSVTGFQGHDRDRGFASERALVMGAISGSLEWSSDWVALLVGVSLPFSSNGREPWTAGLGVAVAPF
jgi:hypothetical protein